MPLKFDKLFILLEKRGHAKTAWLRKNGVHPQTINQMRKNVANPEMLTILKICDLLECQPEDIMEYDEGLSDDGKR